MSRKDETQLSSMTAVWLLPIVSCPVAASSGAIVADILPNPQHALWTVIASYVLWGIGLPLALMVMVIYLQRLTLHKIPPKAMIVSVFLPLGPFGSGGYAYVNLFFPYELGNPTYNSQGDEAWKSRTDDLSPDSHARGAIRANVPCDGFPGRAHFVGFWFGVALLCVRFYCTVQDVPIQYWMVGVHFSHWGVCFMYLPDRSGASISVLSGFRDGKSSFPCCFLRATFF